MNKIIFKKEYTRDNCLILQEVWGKIMQKDFFDNKNPYKPININYVTDGVIEIWENENLIQWFKDKLLEKNLTDREFLSKTIDKHLEIARTVKELLKQEYLNSPDELKDFIKLVKKGTCYFSVFYYSAMDERTPKDLRSKAMDIRIEDDFFGEADRLIKNTLTFLYPHTKDFGLVVLSDEIYNPPTEEILKKRFNGFVVIVDGTRELTNLKDYLKRNPNFEFIFDQVPKENILKGQTANKGFVRGIVRILKRKKQIKDLIKGEILVTHMTTPEFVPAMKKSCAIVTEEGGITCHAAILARELDKPCIIGTKVATKFLKDGDLVEVDADKGIVKILK